MKPLQQPPWGHWHEIDSLQHNIERAMRWSTWFRRGKPEWVPTITIDPNSARENPKVFMQAAKIRIPYKGN